MLIEVLAKDRSDNKDPEKKTVEATKPKMNMNLVDYSSGNDDDDDNEDENNDAKENRKKLKI